MKRTLRPEETRLWAAVAVTLRPHGRPASAAMPESLGLAKPTAASAVARAPLRPPEGIEPNRHHRIARGREEIARRLDLHGMTQEAARATLHGFVGRAHDEGARAVLVITGKGVQGDGVLRRRVPEWLAEAPSRARVAGISSADRRHGGDGALYVALKRR